MALVRVPNRIISSLDLNMIDASLVTIDAAGESCAVIGELILQNGAAATKTVSSAGGKIYARTVAITFANGTTNLRVGLQDPSLTTGLEDAAFDVQGDFVGGVVTINANAFNQFAMTSGSKTLTHGMRLAIVFELTARGGADSVQIDRLGPAFGAGASPYGTADTGTLGKVSGSLFPWAMIECDDGTVGWILGTVSPTLSSVRIGTTYGSGSTPDEYLPSMTPVYTSAIDAVGTDLADIDSGDTFEISVIQDPYGTPSVLSGFPVTVDPDVTNQAAAGQTYGLWAIPETTLTAGVTYGFSFRPTTAGTIQIGYLDLGSGNDKIKRMSPWGDTLKLGARTDQTGAFTVVQDYYWPVLYLRECKLSDNVSAGGSGGFFIQ